MKQVSDLENIRSNIFGIVNHSTIKDFHSHNIAQLSIPVDGVMYIIVEDDLFIVPPGMAVFIPKKTKHCIKKINARTIIENIFFTDFYKNYLPTTTKSFYLSQLATAVISKICTFEENEFNFSPIFIKIIYRLPQNHFIYHNLLQQ